jgi:hypothetical protein
VHATRLLGGRIVNQTIEDRMQAVEDDLKEIRKELEESLALYKQSQYPFTNGDIGGIPKNSYDFPEFKLWDTDEK